MRKTLIKRKKTVRRNKRTKRTRKQRGGGGVGSDLRQKLVSLCRKEKWDEYDALTQKIIYEYRRYGKKDFFIHLDNQMSTFSKSTKLCLERSLTQLQEDGIPESMVHLAHVLDVRDGCVQQVG